MPGTVAKRALALIRTGHGGHALFAPENDRPALTSRAFQSAARWVDHTIGWHRLPTLPGLLVLVGIRGLLRRHNLFDLNDPSPTVQPFTPSVRTARTVDGSYNDLDDPAMGMAGRRFGRNVSPTVAVPETATLLEPNPRLVSRRLLTRDAFLPATSLNVLAATWIQFMVKDWISHGPGDPAAGYVLPLEPDDPWPPEAGPVLVPALAPDPTTGPGLTAFLNENSPWWDASSIYGNSLDQQAGIRTGKGGKLRVDATGLFPATDDPERDPSRVPGFWTGLAMMGSLFCLEHNAVCDALAEAYPQWDDEELFQRSRLVVSALIAKIHTVEWTPAILAHPTTVTALRANWYGLAGQRIRDTFGRVSSNEVLSGIPGGETNHFGVPYSLTEEFSIVYRMHPLVPDDYALRSCLDDRVIGSYTLRDLTGPAGRALLDELEMGDLLYSFGTAHPGAITLHNYPKFLQEFVRPDGRYSDLAATDILRTRELGVPRYNEFRRQLHLTPAATFEELTEDPATVETLRSLYRDIEQVDTIVGMFAEKRPEGFAFSDTAFRIFVLMASRRLNSDRFFTTHLTPEVYSPIGYRWVVENDFSSVLLRHQPQLRSSLAGVGNPFAPWRVAT